MNCANCNEFPLNFQYWLLHYTYFGSYTTVTNNISDDIVIVSICIGKQSLSGRRKVIEKSNDRVAQWKRRRTSIVTFYSDNKFYLLTEIGGANIHICAFVVVWVYLVLASEIDFHAQFCVYISILNLILFITHKPTSRIKKSIPQRACPCARAHILFPLNYSNKDKVTLLWFVKWRCVVSFWINRSV